MIERIALLLATVFTAFIPVKAFTQLQEHPDILLLQQRLRKAATDTARIPILLDIANSYIIRPGELKTDLDSGLLFTKIADSLSSKTHSIKGEGLSLLVYSKNYHERNDSTGAAQFGHKAIGLLDAHKYFELAGDAAYEMSYYYKTDEDVDSSIADKFVEKAAMYYRAAGNPVKIAIAYQRLGEIYATETHYNKAYDTLMAALRINAVTPIKNLPGIYRELSNSKSDVGDYSQALKFMLLSLRATDQTNLYDDNTITLYNQLGLLYYKTEDYPDAAMYFRKAFDLADKNRSFVYIQAMIRNIVNTLNKSGDFKLSLAFLDSCDKKYAIPQKKFYSPIKATLIRCRTFLAMHNYAAIEPYAGTLKQADVNADAELRAVELYTVLIPWSIYKKKYAIAQKYLDYRVQVLAMDNQPVNNAANLAYQYAIDSATGHYQQALATYKSFTLLNDSLLNVKKINQLNQLKIEYQTEKKDQQLLLNQKNIQLLSREEKINKLDLSSTRSARNMMIVAALALVLLLALLYNRYRLKNRTNLALQSQQEEIKQQNQVLQTVIGEKDKLIVEKEWLMKEIHHRVKNNLQVVISLLRMQSSYLNDEEAKRTIRESRQRLQAIALLHQKLYQADQVEVIDMDGYIRELITYLKDSFEGLHNIQFDVQVDHLKLQVMHAVPIGLIINEAVTNAIKYAFTGIKNGVITISLKITNEDQLCLHISDNGIGMDTEKLHNGTGGMGIRLIEMLSGQMNGTLHITGHPGVSVLINDIPFIADLLIAVHQ